MVDRQLNKKKVARKVEILVYEDNTMNVSAPTEFGIAMWILNQAQTAIIKAHLQQKVQEAEPSRIVKPEFKGVIVGGN